MLKDRAESKTILLKQVPMEEMWTGNTVAC